jgi:hypothetical protein
MISFATSHIVELDPGDLHFDLPPDLMTQVVVERSHELASAARAIFEASPEAPQVLLEAQNLGREQRVDIASPETTRSVCRKPVDIAFNGGKIHNIHFNCDNIRNISFNGGNVRNISFGPPLYSEIEEDKASKPPKPTEPGPDLPPLPQPQSLIIQVPPNEKSIGYMSLRGGAIKLQAPDDLSVERLHVVTLTGRSELRDIRAGKASLRIEGGTMEAGQMKCDVFKAVIQAGSLSAPTAERSSIMVISGVLRMEVSESATAQCDIVVISGKAYVEVPTAFEGELNCDISGGRIVRDGETLPDSYRRRALNDRLVGHR